MGTIIGRSKLQVGDILLYKGTSLIAWFIQQLDGHNCNHAALYYKNDTIAEAIGKGVVTQDVATSFEDDNVWVFRHKHHPQPMSTVIGVAEGYLANKERYAFEQLLLLAFLSLTRKPDFNPWFYRAVRTILDRAASLLLKLTAGGKEPMICSEFVYRCYEEALPADYDQFHIEICGTHAQLASRIHPEGADVLESAVSDRIHKNSLLQLTLNQARGDWEAPLSSFNEAGDNLNQPSEEDVNEAIEQYRQSLQEEDELQAARKRVAVPTLPELRASVEGFALSLYKAQHGQADMELMVRSMGETAPVLQNLHQVCKHFVTPNDLWHSPSLYQAWQVNSK